MDGGAEEEAPTVTASTASATASSWREASKKMFSPTEMTRRVMGGREGVCTAGLLLVLVPEGG